MKRLLVIGCLCWASLAAAESPGVDLRAEPGALRVSSLLWVACLPPVLVWCALATRRAWCEDPLRGRRRALRRLLRHLRAGWERPQSSIRQLELWRKLTVEVWGLAGAAPSGSEVTRAAGAPWGRLWDEAEYALFSPAGRLPPDWVARARAAAEAADFKRTIFLPSRWSHWFPAVAAVLIGLLAAPVRGGEPRDWIGRQSAAAAFAQEGKWELAHAHGTAAFALNPRDAAVRTGLRESLAHVPTADPQLRRLVVGRWHQRAAAALSPVQWSGVARGGAVLVAAASSAWLFLGYTSTRRRRMRWVPAGAVVTGIALLTAGLAAHRAYGALANPQVACVAMVAEVRPVPSEAVPRQEASTLLPGTLAIVDRSLLGWDHVVSADGKTAGWLRRDALVWIYRTRPEGLRNEYRDAVDD